MIREIDSHDWQEFCRRISLQRQGAVVSIEVVAPDGLKTERAGNVTLQEMSFDASGACNDIISLRVRNEREELYEVIDPIHIKLKETENGNDFNSVQIDAENGTTWLTIHPAIHAQMLAGLKIN